MLPAMRWDAERYERSFGYVASYGESLVDLLQPKHGERVLDLGCGTGTLTAAIAERGATVTGVDADPGMIAAARSRHPEIAFTEADGHAFSVPEPYDAVFSNAALHWMTDPDAVIARVRDALLPGGRFVAEMGAAGNCAAIIDAVGRALAELGQGAFPELWYFPTPAEHAGRLEAAGFEVRLLHCYERPTPLADCPDGVADWMRMFGGQLLDRLPQDLTDRLLARANELAAPALLRDGAWVADYKRLRFLAVRS